MKRHIVIIGCMGFLLLLLVAAVLYLRHSNDERILELETQLSALREHEKQLEVARQVSKQMEEIANGQEALSEERSQEAIRQSKIAQEMTLRSEAERKNAIQAQAIAENAADEALNAYQMAERQRLEAEEQRKQAEHAKLVADTLNYISLGRTLGAQSYSIYQTGEKELGNMLAYASYLFTSDYKGDLFTPSVFQALTQSAGGRRSWNVHDGSISHICFLSDGNRLLTVSTYGEIFVHEMQTDKLITSRLFSDRHYCFRDAYSSKKGKSFAISLSGHLVVINAQHTHSIFLENVDRPIAIHSMNDNRQLLIVGENSLVLFDIDDEKVIDFCRLPFHVTFCSQRDNKPLLFDNCGGMHLVNSLDNITNEAVPVQGLATSYASSKDNQLAAYGMADGTIWLTAQTGKTYKLVGHLSQVTKLEFDGQRLYSSSYDGKLLFWLITDTQIKPITLFQSGSWLTDFTFSTDRNNIWTGDYTGTISEYLISITQIAKRLRDNVKRNFTQEEWDYHVGKGIPYRKVKGDI